MIDFTICETFDCVGFDLTFIGELSYTYAKNAMTNSVDVTLRECLLEITHEYINIKPCFSDSLLKDLQEELENYFCKSMYWEEKYLNATTGY